MISEDELKEWEAGVARGFSATPARYGRLIAEVRRLRDGAENARRRLDDLDGRMDVARDLEILLTGKGRW